ncbi:class I SAM-dependent methyltransferase [Dactylosporangium fulvum]|uniref:S-adenosyl-L-methionine-dependent methyltransferase n=1 Tax=Dactylosporangium fulvum TaxID=53359 RepID=A0ABY5VRY6_9ACTN|nr:class I SAM-dependent methyltransferase [Dactylosporangium fulvum]UWP80055.1 class I SAM-dependent methyltransferase [Dactylosporangium fulvum]
MNATGRLSSHSDTAEAVAAMRAAETLLPPSRRLLSDPVARHLVRRPAYRLLSRSALAARLVLPLLDRRLPGLHGQVVLRSRYADDAARRAVEAGIRQVVLLGAGFDSTAHRLPGQVTVYEVDVPSTQAVKRSRLAPVPPPAATVVYVPCDFAVDRLVDRLSAAGFDRSAPALFTWLGVVCYLPLPAVDATVADVASLSAPGSRLVLDYVESAVLDGTGSPGAARVARMVAQRGEPFHTGFTPDGIRDMLARHGLTVEDDVDLAGLAARYPAPDGVWCATEGFNRMATASMAGPTADHPTP